MGAPVVHHVIHLVRGDIVGKLHGDIGGIGVCSLQPHIGDQGAIHRRRYLRQKGLFVKTKRRLVDDVIYNAHKGLEDIIP